MLKQSRDIAPGDVIITPRSYNDSDRLLLVFKVKDAAFAWDEVIWCIDESGRSCNFRASHLATGRFDVTSLTIQVLDQE